MGNLGVCAACFLGQRPCPQGCSVPTGVTLAQAVLAARVALGWYSRCGGTYWLPLALSPKVEPVSPLQVLFLLTPTLALQPRLAVLWLLLVACL